MHRSCHCWSLSRADSDPCRSSSLWEVLIITSLSISSSLSFSCYLFLQSSSLEYHLLPLLLDNTRDRCSCVAASNTSVQVCKLPSPIGYEDFIAYGSGTTHTHSLYLYLYIYLSLRVCVLRICMQVDVANRGPYRHVQVPGQYRRECCVWTLLHVGNYRCVSSPHISSASPPLFVVCRLEFVYFAAIDSLHLRTPERSDVFPPVCYVVRCASLHPHASYARVSSLSLFLSLCLFLFLLSIFFSFSLALHMYVSLSLSRFFFLSLSCAQCWASCGWMGRRSANRTPHSPSYPCSTVFSFY